MHHFSKRLELLLFDQFLLKLFSPGNKHVRSDIRVNKFLDYVIGLETFLFFEFSRVANIDVAVECLGGVVNSYI